MRRSAYLLTQSLVNWGGISGSGLLLLLRYLCLVSCSPSFRVSPRSCFHGSSLPCRRSFPAELEKPNWRQAAWIQLSGRGEHAALLPSRLELVLGHVVEHPARLSVAP